MLLALLSFVGKCQFLSFGKNPTVRQDERKFFGGSFLWLCLEILAAKVSKD